MPIQWDAFREAQPRGAPPIPPEIHDIEENNIRAELVWDDFNDIFELEEDEFNNNKGGIMTIHEKNPEKEITNDAFLSLYKQYSCILLLISNKSGMHMQPPIVLSILLNDKRKVELRLYGQPHEKWFKIDSNYIKIADYYLTQNMEKVDV